MADTGTNTDGDAVYLIGGVANPSLAFVPGSAYTVSHPSAHPLRFSATPDGTHGGGVAYTVGVAATGASTTIAVSSSTPNPLYYYCAYHARMGGSIATRTPAVVAAAASGATGTATSAATVTGTSMQKVITV